MSAVEEGGGREGRKGRECGRRDADEDSGGRGGGALLALCHIEVWEFTLL